MTNRPTAVPHSGDGAGPEPADEELIRRWRAGPESAAGRAAIGALFARYDRQVYLWCFRLAGEHHRALDLAQEALLTALRDLHQFEGRSRFSTWLFTLVRRRCFRLLRRERLLALEPVDDEVLVAREPDPAAALAERDEDERVRRAIRDVLEPVEAAALLLRCEEGLPVDEITKLLGIEGASGARGVIQSARRKLRAALPREAREGPAT